MSTRQRHSDIVANLPCYFMEQTGGNWTGFMWYVKDKDDKGNLSFGIYILNNLWFYMWDLVGKGASTGEIIPTPVRTIH